jgi:catechol 2,3-dioxygenase-like lactoylglutathione lyase family enzyme
MTEYRIGRLIDHVHLRARDYEAAKRFYLAVFEALEITVGGADDRRLWCDEFFLDALGDEEASATHIHLAFQARDHAMVQRVHQAGLSAGGIDNGGPGERAYHPGYYSAFLLDPDGNNVEAVNHGPATRSAAFVSIQSDDGGGVA